MIRNSNLLTEKLCRCVDVPGFRRICTSAQEANAAVEMLRHFLLGWGIEMDKPEIGVVQQNKASGKVRRQAEVTFTYTPNGPTLEALLKTLLRTAALPGQAV